MGLDVRCCRKLGESICVKLREAEGRIRLEEVEIGHRLMMRRTKRPRNPVCLASLDLVIDLIDDRCSTIRTFVVKE